MTECSCSSSFPGSFLNSPPGGERRKGPGNDIGKPVREARRPATCPHPPTIFPHVPHKSHMSPDPVLLEIPVKLPVDCGGAATDNHFNNIVIMVCLSMHVPEGATSNPVNGHSDSHKIHVPTELGSNFAFSKCSRSFTSISDSFRLISD